MAYSIDIQREVQKLRGKGKTYSEILKEINISIPKSTLSSWCQNVLLPSGYKKKIEELNKINHNKALAAALASNELKRQKLFLEIERKNNNLRYKMSDKDILRSLLAVLYLGEGAKWRSHRGLMLGSSDPNIVKLYIKLLKLCYGINVVELRCRVSYRADQNIKKLESFLSKVSGIPIKNFYKTIPDPRTIGKATKNMDYKGVCVITCKGTEIQLELEEIPKMILKGL